jgi:hypothetical protein
MSEKEEQQEQEVQLISISFDEKESTEVGTLDAITNQITKFCRVSFEETVNTANELISSQMTIIVGKDDKKSYDEAKELYSKHKNLWVKIDKDTDIIKKNIKPILEKVQLISDDIYNPLQESGKKLKNKMLIYEVEQERKKQEKRDKELAEQKRKEEIATKLLSLNTDYLAKIQNCQTLEELDLIKTELTNYDISIFGEQSANATFQITQLNMTCDMMRSNISMKIEQEKFRKQEEERLAEQKRKEDEELKANQERIAQKLKEEEEEKEAKRKVELEALAKIKEEEEKLKLEQESACIETPAPTSTPSYTFTDAIFVTPKPVTMIVDEKDARDITTEESQEIANSIGNENTCPTSKIDVEEDEKQSLSDDEIFAESIARQPFVKEEQVKTTPAYNEMLKELFEREIVWHVSTNSFVQESELAITLASIVEKQKNIIF